MSSDVEICNVALARLGVGTIQSLGEESRAARLCTVLYPKCVRELIEAHAWHFARKTVDLAEHSVDPPSMWIYRYAYPADCKKALKVTTTGSPRDSDGELYTVEMLDDGSEKTILTDVSPASLTYTYENLNAVFYPELFATAVSARLAVDLCVLLTDGAQGMRQYMTQQFEMALGAARASDLNESNDIETPEPGSVSARD